MIFDVVGVWLIMLKGIIDLFGKEKKLPMFPSPSLTLVRKRAGELRPLNLLA